MEDIYDDLTNYEDVNALEELRSENNELKEKLEKCSTSMEKLQKDYDTLEAEFKKLEHNYSSLLMTARSEIQRKTQRINQLNTEKDLMVLDALKSGVRIRRDFSKGLTKNDNVKQKNDDIKKERCKEPVMSPKVVVPEPETCDRNKSDKASIRIELSSTSKSSVKNNAPRKTDLNERETSTRSIKDRRKSMPAVSMPIDTFGTDDELERTCQTKDRTDRIPTDHERRNINKKPFDRHGNKSIEASSVDDRVHNHHDITSRDNYKGKSSRYHDSNLYRNRDKYDVSSKYKKRFTPERGQKRQHKENNDYHRYESDRYKGRHLESPPPESYNRYQHRKSDPRSEYHRYSNEKVKYNHEDKYSSTKYRSKEYDEPHAKRLRSESYDEPRAKRLRSESYGNPDACTKEDKRHYHERVPVDVQPVPCFSPEEYDIVSFSCQSPDFEHTDAYPIKEIMTTAATPLDDPRVTSKRYVVRKENGKKTLSTVGGRNFDIRPINKAEWNFKPVDIPLGLLRRPSQCSDQLVKDIYMDIDNPVSNLDFSIESGEFCETDEETHEIRNIPKTKQCDIQDFKISKQLTRDISKQAGCRILETGQNKQNMDHNRMNSNIELDENVPHHKKVYRKTAEDISSKESFTLKQQYNEHEEFVTKKDTLPNNKKYEVNEKSRPKQTEDSLRKELSTHKHQHNEHEERMVVKDSLPDNKTYSKVDRHKKSRSREREDSFRKESRKHDTHKQQNDHDERADVDDSLFNKKHNSKIEGHIKSRSREKELSTHKQQYKGHVNKEDSLPNSNNYSKMEGNKLSNTKERNEKQNQSILTNIAIVADDLELSDDNSDHLDTYKRVTPAKLQKICEMPININKAVTDDSSNNADNKTLTSSYNTEMERTLDNAKTTEVAKDERRKESDGARKQKSKKKKSKGKETTKDLVEITADDTHVPDKKPRSKKEKESTPRETKEKFSDLFGDSNSLMTPEDLGIPSYLPISEDVQDAVDIKINHIIDATPLNDKYQIPRDIETQSRVEVNKIEETKAHGHIPKAVLQKSNTDVDDKGVTENEKKSSKSNEENLVEPSQLPSPIVYENLNPETDLHDPNVVKTVIISTGKQPEIAYENKVEVETKPISAVEINAVPNTVDVHLLPATKEYKSDLLKALATSTPHKEFSAVNPLLSDAAKTDVIHDPCVSKAIATITNTGVANQTETNTLEMNDAPDVRIFVKRRRKVVKRPPMT